MAERKIRIERELAEREIQVQRENINFANVTATGVFPTGTKEITENGTYNVTVFENAAVSVPAESGWLVLPEPKEEEVYQLLDVPANRTDALYLRFYARCMRGSNTTPPSTIEFGTVENGEFVPDDELTVSFADNAEQHTVTIPMAKLVLAGGGQRKQIIMKIAANKGNTIRRFGVISYSGEYADYTYSLAQIKAWVPHLNTGGGGTGFGRANNLRSVSLKIGGTTLTLGSMFEYCSRLSFFEIAGDLSANRSLYSMFNQAPIDQVPSMDTSNVTNFNNTFSGTTLVSPDFSDWNFKKMTGSGTFFTPGVYPGTITFGDTFPDGGVPSGIALVQDNGFGTSLRPSRIKINKFDVPLKLNRNATSVFSGNYLYIYVPDDLIEAYRADTYWASLGARLKPFSELPEDA